MGLWIVQASRLKGLFQEGACLKYNIKTIHVFSLNSLSFCDCWFMTQLTYLLGVTIRGELPFIELTYDCHSVSVVHRRSVLFTMLELWKSNCQQLWVPFNHFFVFPLSLLLLPRIIILNWNYFSICGSCYVWLSLWMCLTLDWQYCLV